MGIMGDALRSLTGNVKTAELIIDDFRKAKASGAGLDALGMLTTAASKLGGPAGAVLDALTDTRKTFKVQFNPSELQVYARGAEINKTDAQRVNKVQNSIVKSHVPPTIELTVNLIFDDVHIYDAFMVDKFTSGASVQTVKNVAGFVKALLGKDPTVRTEVEGLISALRNPYTRNVTFQWADFSFKGQLVNVGAKYTMFSVGGRPIRANVMLRLRQELDPDKVHDWYKDMEDGLDGGKLSLAKAGQMVGNMLNLNL